MDYNDSKAAATGAGETPDVPYGLVVCAHDGIRSMTPDEASAFRASSPPPPPTPERGDRQRDERLRAIAQGLTNEAKHLRERGVVRMPSFMEVWASELLSLLSPPDVAPRAATAEGEAEPSITEASVALQNEWDQWPEADEAAAYLVGWRHGRRAAPSPVPTPAAEGAGEVLASRPVHQHERAAREDGDYEALK